MASAAPFAVDPGAYADPVALFINGIGDSLMTLPALRALTRVFPESLTLITADAPYADLFAELPLRRLVRTPIRTTGGPRDGASVQRFLGDDVTRACGRCDLFLSLVPWWDREIARLVQYWQPRLSVGIDAAAFDIAVASGSGHSARTTFEVVRALDPRAEFEQFLAPPRLPADTQRMVHEVRRLADGFRVLCVHNETTPEKQWPAERFEAAVHRFLDGHADYVCIVLGRSIRPDSPVLSHPRIISTGELGGASRTLPLSIVLGLVSEADLFFGVDSCFLHMADLHGVPSVGLFGPTRATEFGFLVAPHRTLQGRRTMTDIPVGRALAALDELRSTPRGPRCGAA